MEKLIITGPCQLRGDITVSGSKNAALPILAATVLAPGKYRIANMPMITDIEHLLAILIDLGAIAKLADNICEIDTTDINSWEPDPHKVRSIRASILLLGPLLARFGKAKLAHPGGCFIGARPVGTHFDALVSLGANIVEDESSYCLEAAQLIGKRITLGEISVTATENLLMAAALATGNTEIRLAATEPHVVDLCHFLVAMGSEIEGIGTHTLVVHGKQSLHPTDFEICSDQIEAGTFAIAAAASRGDLTIHGYIESDQDILTKMLLSAGVNIEIIDERTARVKASNSLRAIPKIRTDIYPNFPSDLQAPMGVLMTQAEGTSTILETMFEGRLNYINELGKMGADCVIKNAHEATISGPTPLFGTTIESFDLRAGATLLIASFIAVGESTIEKAELIDRGYEKIDERLSAVGAKIQRVSN